MSAVGRHTAKQIDDTLYLSSKLFGVHSVYYIEWKYSQGSSLCLSPVSTHFSFLLVPSQPFLKVFVVVWMSTTSVECFFTST